jgi:Fe2+ or Zn2+ uptake regulation protein
MSARYGQSGSDKEKQRRREEIRREVLSYLATRSVIALSAEAIHTGLKRKFKFSIQEVEAALVFQVEQGAVSETPDPHGATPYYKATAAGVLIHERNRPNK